MPKHYSNVHSNLWSNLVKVQSLEQDIVEELGPDMEHEAHIISRELDRDGNGDVSLEEMIGLVTGISEFART